MVTPFEFLLIALATFRLTRFFIWDTLMGGNPESGSSFSAWLDNFAYDDRGRDRSWIRGKIGDLLTCPWCWGFHVAWITLCLWTRLWPWELGIHGWGIAFAAAGVAGFLDSWTGIAESIDGVAESIDEVAKQAKKKTE